MYKKCYYVYVDWTLEDAPRPFYVGKGNRNRIRDLIRNAKHANVAKKHGMRREVIHGSYDPQFTCDEEIRLIAEYHTFVDDPLFNGIGCNFTSGGDGTNDYHYTEEQLLRHRQIQNSHETRRRKSVSQLAVSEQKSRSVKEALALPAEQARRSKDTSERNKRNWQDPTYRQHTLEHLTSEKFKRAQAAAMARPEIRAIRRENSKRMWSDPAFRKRMSKPVKCGLCKEQGHNRRTCRLLTSSENNTT